MGNKNLSSSATIVYAKLPAICIMAGCNKNKCDNHDYCSIHIPSNINSSISIP